MGVLIVVLVSLLYLGLALLADYHATISPALNAVRAITALAVFFVYIGAGIRAALKHPRDLAWRDHLIIGIGLTWLTAALFALSNDTGRIFGVNLSVVVNPWVGYFGWLMVLAGLFHLTAPGLVKPASVARSILAAIVVYAVFRLILGA